ncbi:hypothetical protein BJ912DRAFT_808861, partial [Pholiota molesta]
NCALATKFDIILVQEPYVHPKYGHIRAPNKFLGVYPKDRIRSPEKLVRSVIWVNAELQTGTWRELPISGNNDITAIQLVGEDSKLAIFNIYNDGEHMNTIKTLK